MSTTEYYDGHSITKLHPSLKHAVAEAELSLQDARVKSVKVFKAGRNEPCPCGSGKKFKKCCWGKIDQTTEAELSAEATEPYIFARDSEGNLITKRKSKEKTV